VPLAFDRVGQVAVALASGKTRIGSGFLLAPRLVLTAAHVVEDAGRPAQRLTVRFPAAGNGAVSGSPV
jgi:V8-like Glu-specific endopeptidase